MATASPPREAEGGLQKWEKEEKEKEKEEKEAAAVRPSAGEEAPGSPQALLSLRREARDEGPIGVKPELHLLQGRWALWFFKNDRSRAWQDNLHLVTKFDTVEDFWAVYSHIQLASKLSSGCDYALFKLLCLIGESFEEYSREVCGAVINIRTKGDKIAVWTREAENQTGVLHIGRVYKERLGLSTKTIIGYQAHADTATKSNTLAKNKFVV
ncbi:eukaryotic translation initiation factor 4E type 1B isoform X2 [Rousettus aegyptiacus]|uniref:eukaryotic translation initiation factor 4E type 1B isoform X2 n=1 Tax=Rousettus aegyptiacus TaxID=9407 RepID=UPI00168D6C5A|nr:eukaryotic translation initiation factor 4E type 1B isoform X2 [Rousettus aegyptiacus]